MYSFVLQNYIMKKFLILLLLFVTGFTSIAAENSLLSNTSRPKVGLTLSGGGAKGLIYVGLLKMIDSLNIKVDYITGTSMGSIVGGLYAIGYSGNELDSLARNTNWNKYLTNNVPLNRISMEEKDEYGRYMIELNSNTLMPGLPIAVINGQNITTFLNDLTFRVHHISDFDKFPIPFKCISVDIVTGNPVVLDKGSLALALRSSMSIPTAFSPMDTGKMLLVDGGLFKNFPVEYVKKMGAEFVIGANCSGMLLKKKEITSLVNMLEQTTTFSIAADFEQQKKLCDILIDYNEALNKANIGTMDFGKAKQILSIGEEVARQFLEPLVQLSQEQKRYYVNEKDTSELNKTDSLKMQDIELTLDKSNLEAIVKNKIRLKHYNNISKTEINKTVDIIYGTRYFDKVFYYVENNGNKHNLIIKTEKTRKFAYKLGLHYDNEMSAGIIANITARNWLFNASRFITTIDISDNPKARLGYQVYVGNKGFYVSTNHFFELVKQPVFFDRKNLGIYKNQFFQSDILMNYASSPNSAISAGIQFKWGNSKPAVKNSDRPDFSTSLFTLNKRPYLNSSIILKYAYNSFNQQTFPTKGINILLHSEFIFAGKTTSFIHTETIKADSDLNILISKNDTILKHHFNPYFKLYASYEHIFRLHKKVSLDAKIDAGMIFLLRSSNNDFTTQQADAFYIGGVEPRERERTTSLIPFWGNRQLYVQNLNFLTASLSLQYEPVKNLLIIPKVSVFTGDDGNTSVYGNKGVINNLKNKNLLFVHSEGLTIAYKTPIGPVRVNLSKASNSSKPLFYFSLGYRI